MLCLDRPASVPVVRRVFAGLVGPVQLLNECAYFAKESVRVGCKFPISCTPLIVNRKVVVAQCVLAREEWARERWPIGA